jgi:hypothetical protein
VTQRRYIVILSRIVAKVDIWSRDMIVVVVVVVVLVFRSLLLAPGCVAGGLVVFDYLLNHQEMNCKYRRYDGRVSRLVGCS